MLPLCVSHLSLKYIPPRARAMACCYAMRSLLPSSPLRTASHAVRLPHPVARSTRATPPSRVALHPLPCPLQLATHRDAAGVLLTPPFPTRRSWLLSTPWMPWLATSARRCYDESACCKRMFQMFQTFLRYVAIVLYRWCKSRSGMLHMLCMLQVFQRFVQNVLSVLDERCKFWSRCCICFHTYVAAILAKCFSCFSLTLQ
jgi:hypothetical protein